jgi:hypothetical protein
MSANWRQKVIPAGEMETEDIRAELRHDLRVYEQVGHPLSKQAMAARITALVEEMDRRVLAAVVPEETL